MNVALTATAAVTSLWAIGALRRMLPASWPRPPHPQAATKGVVGDLERVQRIVASAGFAGDVHWRLRPMLREVAQAGLLRHRVRLDEDPDRANH